MSNAQWFWYAAQIAADKRERFELLRDVAEHNAMFWNPQGVEQMREARKRTYVVDDKSFARQLEETFGRKLVLPDRGNASVAPPLQIHDAKRQMRMGPNVDTNRYLEAELDEIVFTPFEQE